VERAIQLGLALGSHIAERSIFARKNYFYPDLPKGYQISQFEIPVVQGGEVSFFMELGKETVRKTVRLVRAHLEEDAGKSLHEDSSLGASIGNGRGHSGIDLNRAGTPLLEIVTEPDMRSSTEAVAYAKELHKIVTWIGICDGNMQDGSFRCDANVSVRKPGAPLGTRREIKNLNSFKFMQQAIDYEVRWLPRVMAERFVTQYGLPEYDATQLTQSKAMAAYFEAAAKACGQPKLASNWIMGEVSRRLNSGETSFDALPLSAAQLAALIGRISDNTISNNAAKQVFDALWSEGSAKVDDATADAARVDALIDAKGLKQINDTGALEAIIDEVLAANPKNVEEFKAGNAKALNGLVGPIMKASKGKANPAQVNELLLKKLS
jgi:aspartyl-tRNA(Asn)/glutamyl-tRNA(Gln) amidotransferase subunit B